MISEDIREKNEEELQLNETAQAEAINEESAEDFPEGFEESSDNDLSVELELLADELQQPEAEQPEDEQPEAEQSEDEQPEAEQSEDEQPEDEQPEADQSEDEQPEAEQPEDEQSEAEQPEAEQSEDEQSEDEQPEAEQSEDEQPEAEQSEDEQPEAEQSEDEQPEAEQSEDEQPEAEQPEDEQSEDEQSEDEQPEAEQSEDEQSEAEQPEDEQPEAEQPEAEQPEDEQPEAEQPEDEQPEAEQPEDEQPEEDGLINERITDLVDDLQEVFNDGSEEDKNEVSSADLFMLANELGSDSEDPDEEFAEERTVEFDLSDRVNSLKLNEYSSDSEIKNQEDNFYIEDNNDDDVKIFVKQDYSSYEEDDDVKVFHGGNQPEPDYSDEEMVIDLSESVGEIEHTNVFELVRPQPTYGGAGGYSPDYAEIRRKKRYGFFKGLAQIAALLAVVVGLAWLLSVVAFSVMGADDTVSADEYNYSTSSTIIKPFKDDQEPEPVVVPDFTAEKLTLGDKGDMVDAVQRTLASLGYLNQGDVSGVYDSTTKNAVVMFQKANYLEATGVVDKSTYQLIFDSNATAPTTRTTDLPTTTEAETQTTGTETPTSASQTESVTSSASSSEETKPTTATSADSSDEDRTSDNPSDTAPTEAEPIISENNDSYLNTSENIGNP